HAAAGGCGIGAAKSLVGIGFFFVDDAFALDAVEGLAAHIAGDDGLADHFELFGFAVVFAAQALSLDHFEFFWVFLADVNQFAGVHGGGAVLETFGIFTH